MNIKVTDIQPNPYRNMDKYPIDRKKVLSLKTSINETEFWDNLLVRPKPNHTSLIPVATIDQDSNDGFIFVGPALPEPSGNDGEYTEEEGLWNGSWFKNPIFELAYGHHRIQAIRELGIETVDLPVKNLDNATMLRIMANENMDDWKATPAIINETVYAAKAFIDAELAKYATWEEAKLHLLYLADVLDERTYQGIRGKGAGRNIITAFLGGNWKAWMVEASLQMLNNKEVDREAAEVFDSTESAKSFSSAVKSYSIPQEEQKKIAQTLKKEGNTSKREIRKAVQREVLKREPSVREDNKEVKEDKEVKKIFTNTNLAVRSVAVASVDIQNLVNSLERNQVIDFSSIEALGLKNNVVTLLRTIEKIAPYFGIQIQFDVGDEEDE